MASQGKNRLIRSFGYAIAGIYDVLAHEKNMHIHLCAAVITIVGAALLKFPMVHWLILLLVIAVVFSLEIMNTAVERTVDLVTEEYHPVAKCAKDVAAASVFVFSLFAVVIGLILFIPPLIRLLS